MVKSNQHKDLYQEITDKIIAEMEQGRLPWVQPWDSSHTACAVGLPVNASTQRQYSGINILILWGAVFDRDFTSQNWLTFKQAKALGGTVRKGEHGQVVCYADRFTPQSEREQAKAEGREAQSIPFLKRYRVFNIDQCDGLPNDIMASPQPFYSPSLDYIQLPPQPAFTDQINYYRTLFHELSHQTGHPSRLNRDQTGSFGSKTYAREELVAEMGSAFICAALNIVPTVRHADYLAGWMDVLKEDKRAMFRAASQACKVAEYLLPLSRVQQRQRLSRKWRHNLGCHIGQKK